MYSGVEKVTIDLAKAMLDVAALKHNVHAANIANVHTEGYKPQKVDFEAQLQSIISAVNHSNYDSAAQAIKHLDLLVTDDTEQNKVSLDKEAVAMLENRIHYQTLTEALSKKMGLMKLALRGNNQ